MLSHADRTQVDKRTTTGDSLPFRLSDIAEAELHADVLHEAVMASAEARRPSRYFSYVVEEADDKFT